MSTYFLIKKNLLRGAQCYKLQVKKIYISRTSDCLRSSLSCTVQLVIDIAPRLSLPTHQVRIYLTISPSNSTTVCDVMRGMSTHHLIVLMKFNFHSSSELCPTGTFRETSQMCLSFPPLYLDYVDFSFSLSPSSCTRLELLSLLAPIEKPQVCVCNSLEWS